MPTKVSATRTTKRIVAKKDPAKRAAKKGGGTGPQRPIPKPADGLFDILKANSVQVDDSFGAPPGRPAPLKITPAVALDEESQRGVLRLRTSGKDAVTLNRESGNIELKNGDGQNTIRLDGSKADLIAGGAGQAGSLTLRNAEGKNALALRAAHGDDASIIIGEKGRSGWIVVRNGLNKDAVFLSGHDLDGLIELRRVNGNTTIRLEGDGSAGFGGGGVNGNVFVYPDSATSHDEDQASVWIQGSSGDVVLRNSDCAEEFDVVEGDVEPGTVLVLDSEPGRLRISDRAYDGTVAGVVSGAGSCRPGIILGRNPHRDGRQPVALVGKVFCKVDATAVPVRPGSLLTTAELPGHAMAVVDRTRAFGAVLGKALQGLDSGRGLIPILVALQ